MCAFDCTYVTRTLQQCQIHGKRGMVGGIFRLEESDNPWLSLDNEEGIDISKVVRAAQMLEMLLWDPSAIHKTTLSVCSLPIETNFSGPGSTQRGCWFMVELIGRVLHESDHLVKGLVFDAHGSHSVIRRVLHGQLQSVDLDTLKSLPFWQDCNSWSLLSLLLNC